MLRSFFGQEEDYCKPVRVGDFWSNYYIKYISNRDRNKTLLIKGNPDEIIQYLKDIIDNLKKFDTWKIQFTIAINL